MQYNLKGTDVELTQEIRSYLEKKLSALDKYVRRAEGARVDVELKFKPLWDGQRYGAEFTYHEPGSEVMRVEARGDALHEAIDLVSAELSREMTTHKKKTTDVLRRGALQVKEYLRGWRDRF